MAVSTDKAVPCRWDVNVAKYRTLAIEPDDAGWQTLDVVTGVGLGTQMVRNKSIEAPPRTAVT